MELKHIQWENSPSGAWINSKDFNPSAHKLWVEPVPEIVEIIETAEPVEIIETAETAEIAEPQKPVEIRLAAKPRKRKSD